MNQVFEHFILSVFPKQLFTAFVGKFAKSSFSRYFIPLFIRYYQINCSEAEWNIDKYENLQQFFCRKLKQGVRPVCSLGISAPVDGCVSELGSIQQGTMLQAKGNEYLLEDLLASIDDAKQYMGGTYITIYLSPRNYHRIHMPYDGTCVKWVHVPGRLFPVNPMGVRSISGLFTKNERVITHVKSSSGSFCLVKIGAAGVGSVRTSFIPKYHNHARRNKVDFGKLDIQKRRGEELGWFEFGSTVILVFEPGMVKKFTVNTGDFVQMGKQIAVNLI